MSTPKVSICCLTYNHEKYVRQCLDGFMMQKIDFPFEVLIHDDASTDATADIIREYEAKYPEIFKPIYQTENQYSKGGSINGTYNFPRAKGEYIALCEGDDYWTDPLKLKTQIDLIEKHNVGFSFHAAEIFKYNQDEFRVDKSSFFYGDDIKILSNLEVIDSNGQTLKTPLASFVFKKEIVDQLQSKHPEFYKKNMSHSFLTLWAAYSTKLLYVPRYMSVYRHSHKGSWNYRRKSDKTFKKDYNLKIIRSYNAFNKITQYEFDTLFKKNINNRVFNVLKNINIPIKDRKEFLRDAEGNISYKNKIMWFLIFKREKVHHFLNKLFKSYQQLSTK